jgi:hypothetical protein
MRNETAQRQGSDERESRHSVGHLCIVHKIHGKHGWEPMMYYLVQVPEARGKVTPDIDSISEDFPALCAPTTAMTGMSSSR